MRPSSKLYKYCPINANTLSAMLRAKVFHSPPVRFNDPLDCNPSIEIDISVSDLHSLLRKLMSGFGYDNEKVETEIRRIQYFATEFDHDKTVTAYDEDLSYQLGQEIMRLVRQELGVKGVLSLSENWNDPLLWSHYAAQHQGICIEYETTGFDNKRLKAVNYHASRSVRAHDLYRWKCEDDSRAETRVIDTYFYAKAPQWAYEQEWRDINDIAEANPSHFDLKGIYFGIRAEFVWKLMLVKTLHLDPQVILYDVTANEKTFELHRRQVDRDELARRGIDQPAFRVFANLDAQIRKDLSVGEKAIFGKH